jgi:hypothetical protein
LPDMTTVATGQFPSAGLSSTGSTTSVAAPQSTATRSSRPRAFGVAAASS